MINNQREYIIAMAQVVKLQCEFVTRLGQDSPGVIERAQINALESEIASLRCQIDFYKQSRKS